MADDTVEVIPGTVEMLMLKALSGAPMHGFGIARWIESVTGERLSVDEGALYPALHRMQKKGWLTSEWSRTENGRRAKYYTLTDAGHRELSAQKGRWRASALAIDQVLGARVR